MLKSCTPIIGGRTIRHSTRASFGRNGQRVTKWTLSIHFIGICLIPIFSDAVADIRVSRGDIHADGLWRANENSVEDVRQVLRDSFRRQGMPMP
ncbi:hypothetical protein PILCRDRAFT_540034 [Piloderma croceum F 1598]|uniref:Uncharacterized protein n=1 Tax=Piloderma croceum (strain F 1598) TaxID=765440 RepID=A0A0C3FK35_PILCF|nr:hypothetical protein PILCRDRAFT_540034 [Piloderma croceum F 1598]